MNDLFWLAHEESRINLRNYKWQRRTRDNDESSITHALTELRKQLPDAVRYAADISTCLASFDWRTSKAVPTDDPNYDKQASYRGSGGYRTMRQNALEHLERTATGRLSESATSLLQLLGYEEGEED